jgi:hypothetical protein
MQLLRQDEDCSVLGGLPGRSFRHHRRLYATVNTKSRSAYLGSERTYNTVILTWAETISCSMDLVDEGVHIVR